MAKRRFSHINVVTEAAADEAAGGLPNVSAPRQQRSRAVLNRVLAVAEGLLETKSFESITIAEIAGAAGVSPTSIYARFDDKTAILTAVHERFKTRTIIAFAARLDAIVPEAGADDILSEVADALVEVYTSHRRMLRSVMLADDELMYERVVALLNQFGELTADRIGLTAVGPLSSPDRARVNIAVHSAVAFLQQCVLFGWSPAVASGEATDVAVKALGMTREDIVLTLLRSVIHW